MVPFERSPTSINGNGGYVLWGPLPDGEPWQFLVRIDKVDSDRFNVRSYRGK